MSWRAVFTIAFAMVSSFICSLMCPALAQPSRVALVIGNAAYTSLPPTPICIAATRAIAEKLRAAGYDVVSRNNVTTGGFEEATIDFTTRLVRSPGAGAFIYICSRGASLNDRAFLLPVSATLERPTDIFTQGILVKSLHDTIKRSGASTAVIALDVVPPPTGPRPTGFDAIADIFLVERVTEITVMSAASGSVVTPLAQALVSILSRPVLESGTLLSSVHEELKGTSGLSIAIARPSKVTAYVVGQAPLAPVPPPSPTPPVADPIPPAATPAPAPAVAIAPPSPATPAPPALVVPPSPVVVMPEEHLLTFDDRRRIQEALRSLGYYNIAIDGIFGTETRAAIRKYQLQIMAPITGRLTSEQAALLVTGR